MIAATPIATSVRAARVKRIKQLMIDWTQNILQLGKELSEERETFRGPRGSLPGWENWLKQEIGISRGHAGKLINIFEQFGDAPAGSIPETGFKVLSFLSGEEIPEVGRQEVIERIKKGEKIGKGKAKKIVDKHRPPPKQAMKQATETGRPVAATDGNLYFPGATKEKIKNLAQRRNVVFGVHRAIDTLAAMQLSPHEFLEYAAPHQLWRPDEEHKIGEAAEWLRALHTAWQRRK